MPVAFVCACVCVGGLAQLPAQQTALPLLHQVGRVPG